MKLEEGNNFLQAAASGWNIPAGFSDGLDVGLDTLYTIGFGALGALFGAFPQIGANLFNANSIDKIDNLAIAQKFVNFDNIVQLCIKLINQIVKTLTGSSLS